MRGPLRAPTLLALGALYGCGADVAAPLQIAGPETPLSQALIAEAAYCQERDLHVVAHPDDDLLFMNPSLQDEIQAGHCVRTVVLTAGDAGEGDKYWRNRESGITHAYADMAGLDSRWTQTDEPTTGGNAAKLTLSEAPHIIVYFLRLPDGNSHGEGFSRQRHASLRSLFKHDKRTLTTVDGQAAYRAQDLIDTLNGIIQAYAPTAVHTLDPSSMHGGDHSDHRVSALFTHLARRGYTMPHDVFIYRGYNISHEAQNLSADDADRKWRTFLRYAPFDAHIDPSKLDEEGYAAWARRQYVVSPTRPDRVAGPVIEQAKAQPLERALDE